MDPTSTGGGAPQAGAESQPQAGAASGGQEPPAGDGAPAAGENPEQTLARVQRELADARREAAQYRTRAQAAERERQARDQAGMSEAERATAEAAELKRANAELKQQLQDQGLRQASLEAASKLGFRSPDLAYRLLDREAVEYKDGEPKNVEALLRELLKDEPYLAKTAGSGDFGGGQRGATPPTAPSMNDALRAIVRG